MYLKSIKVMLIIFSLVLAELWAQEEFSEPELSDPDEKITSLANLVSPANREIRWGGYGGPEVRATTFVKEWGVLVGGRGGFLVNRMFSFGLVGAGFAKKIDWGSATNSDGEEEDISLYMGYGGVYFEYIWGMDKIVHFSIPLDLVVIGTKTRQGNYRNRYYDALESDAMFGVIPRFNVEFNITSFMIISLTGGYRFAFGEDTDDLDIYDVWGPEMGILFKFGKF